MGAYGDGGIVRRTLDGCGGDVRHIGGRETKLARENVARYDRQELGNGRIDGIAQRRFKATRRAQRFFVLKR